MKPITTADYQSAKALEMLERTLQEHVRKIVAGINKARPGSLLYYHTHRSQHSPAGFPDVIIISPKHGMQLVAELKREKECYQPSEPQREWLDAFVTAGVPTFVWRPRYLLSGEILRLILGVEDGSIHLDDFIDTTESKWKGW